MAKKKKTAKHHSTENLDEIIANENILEQDIVEEIEMSMLNYAVMTLSDRAIPEIQDGLKPVHRRILWTGVDSGYDYNKPFVKVARFAGDVMGKYHPHSGCEPTIAQLTRDWKMRYKLIDYHGNYGSIDGDSESAPRYVEARLHKNAYTLLEDVKDKHSVPFVPNYSEDLEEPVTLPALLPNFLVNPSEGIAVGFTTKTPSHNINEVCDAIAYAIQHEDYTLDDLLKYIKGPDMPTGSLLSSSGIRELYETGKQKLTFRAEYKLEEHRESGNPQIVFTSIPPDVNKPKVVELIGELINTKALPRCLEVRDESKGMNIRIVIECQPTANIPMIISDIYAKTNLQKNISFIMRGMLGNSLKLVKLTEYVDIYINYRKEVLKKRLKYQLNLLNKKLVIQEGLKIVSNDIKNAINKIIDSESNADAKTMLMNDYKINSEQADYILDKKINSLSHVDRNKVFELIEDLQNKIAYYEELLFNQDKLKDYMVEQLEGLKSTMGDDRRTVIVEDFENCSENIDMPENVILTLSTNNALSFYEEEDFVKFKTKSSFRERQNYFKQVLTCKRNGEILILFKNGEIERYYVSDLQFNNMKINNVLNIIPYGIEDKKLFLICKNGFVKKISTDKIKVRKGKKTNIIDTDSEIIYCKLVEDIPNEVVTVATKLGNIARFSVNSFGTSSFGSKGMATCSLEEEDYIIDVKISDSNEDKENNLLVIYTNKQEDLQYKVISLEDVLVKGRKASALSFLNNKDDKYIKQIAIGKTEFELFTFNHQVYKFDNFKVSRSRINNGSEFNYTLGTSYQNLYI